MRDYSRLESEATRILIRRSTPTCRVVALREYGSGDSHEKARMEEKAAVSVLLRNSDPSKSLRGHVGSCTSSDYSFTGLSDVQRDEG